MVVLLFFRITVFDEDNFFADQICFPRRVFRNTKEPEYFGICFNPAFYADGLSFLIHDFGNEFRNFMPFSREQLHHRTDNCRNNAVGILVDRLH